MSWREANAVDWGGPVSRAFFERPTEEMALRLLGAVLVRESADGLTAGRIVELEMYRGPGDKAAHSFGGRRTARTQVMFGPPGYAYVYLIYGMYYCLNVVTAAEGSPEAVLIRALEPLTGISVMAGRRQMAEPRTVSEATRLTAGPGRLARAFAIDKTANGHPLWRPPLYIAEGGAVEPQSVARGPRVNIGYAEEARDYPWRFWIKDNPFVSRP